MSKSARHTIDMRGSITPFFISYIAGVGMLNQASLRQVPLIVRKTQGLKIEASSERVLTLFCHSLLQIQHELDKIDEVNDVIQNNIRLLFMEFKLYLELSFRSTRMLFHRNFSTNQEDEERFILVSTRAEISINRNFV